MALMLFESSSNEAETFFFATLNISDDLKKRNIAMSDKKRIIPNKIFMQQIYIPTIKFPL